METVQVSGPVPPRADAKEEVSAGRSGLVVPVLLWVGGVLVAGILVWQAFTSGGNPDPLAPGISPAAAVMNTGIVVFREGLEAVLVLAALTASMVRRRQDFWKPIALGAAKTSKIPGSIAASTRLRRSANSDICRAV